MEAEFKELEPSTIFHFEKCFYRKVSEHYGVLIHNGVEYRKAKTVEPNSLVEIIFPPEPNMFYEW